MDAIQEKLNRLPGALLPWYRENRRVLPWREEVTPYRTWVAEVMLQQTRVQAALPYFLRFMEAAPDIPALAALLTAVYMLRASGALDGLLDSLERGWSYVLEYFR